MNPKLLHILQHSLGVDQHGRGNQYRNYFATSSETTDWPLCQELCASGHMRGNGAQQITGGMHYFSVTPKGVDAVAIESPAPPKVSRGRQRYQDYLDLDASLSFGEYLKYLTWKRREGRAL